MKPQKLSTTLKHTMMLGSLTALLVGGCAGSQSKTATSTAKSLGVDMLAVADDESALERQLRDYIQDKYDFSSEYREVAQNDGFLVFRFEGDNKPDFRVTLDTSPSSENGRERSVHLNLYTQCVVPDTEPERHRVLELLNSYHDQHWAGTFIIDEDRELYGQVTLNVPAVPIPKEMVADRLVRLVLSWKRLFTMLSDNDVPLSTGSSPQ